MLTWTAVPGNNSYAVKRATVSGGPYATVISGYQPGATGALTYLDAGLTDGTTYYYVVTATNVAGEGLPSNEAAATPTAVPAAPTGLTATAGDGQVALAWGAVAGATGYIVEQSTTSGGPYVSVGTTADTAYTDTAVADGTTYYYVVVAADAGGDGAPSNEASATPGAGTSAPSGLVALPGDGQVTLSWAAAPGATGYDVRRATASGGPYAVVASGVPGSPYTDAGLTDGTAYFYVVCASSSSGEGPDSAEAMAVPLALAGQGSGQNSSSYGYTGDGLRAWKQPAGNGPVARTYFLYDGDAPVAEMDAQGSVTAVNTWGAAGLVSRHAGSGTSPAGSVFYAFDERGNVAQRTDGSGAVLGSYAFDAFGLRTGADNNTADPYSFFGGQYGYYEDAETGLELLTRRYYDPAAGRFLTRDPLGYGGGLNLYGYTADDPINHNDPTGLRKYRIHNSDHVDPIGDAGGTGYDHQDYIIDIPDPNNVDLNIAIAEMDKHRLDEGSLHHSLNAKKAYLTATCGNGGVGDYGKNLTMYPDSDPGKNYYLHWQRRLGANFNLGAMGAALGLNLEELLFAGEKLSVDHGAGWHFQIEQDAIEDGYWYYWSKHGGRSLWKPQSWGMPSDFSVTPR